MRSAGDSRPVDRSVAGVQRRGVEPVADGEDLREHRHGDLGRRPCAHVETDGGAEAADERLQDAARRLRRMESEAAAARHALDEVAEKLRLLRED